MKKVFASVLITNFNKEKFLKKTLNSCKNQSFKDKEVIIFDDRSTDYSLSVIKKFKHFKLIKILRKSKKTNNIFTNNKKIFFKLNNIDLYKGKDRYFNWDHAVNYKGY